MLVSPTFICGIPNPPNIMALGHEGGALQMGFVSFLEGPPQSSFPTSGDARSGQSAAGKRVPTRT